MIYGVGSFSPVLVQAGISESNTGSRYLEWPWTHFLAKGTEKTLKR